MSWIQAHCAKDYQSFFHFIFFSFLEISTTLWLFTFSPCQCQKTQHIISRGVQKWCKNPYALSICLNVLLFSIVLNTIALKSIWEFNIQWFVIDMTTYQVQIDVVLNRTYFILIVYFWLFTYVPLFMTFEYNRFILIE